MTAKPPYSTTMSESCSFHSGVPETKNSIEIIQSLQNHSIISFLNQQRLHVVEMTLSTCQLVKTCSGAEPQEIKFVGPSMTKIAAILFHHRMAVGQLPTGHELSKQTTQQLYPFVMVVKQWLGYYQECTHPSFAPTPLQAVPPLLQCHHMTIVWFIHSVQHTPLYIVPCAIVESVMLQHQAIQEKLGCGTAMPCIPISRKSENGANLTHTPK
jgi:hypothetical protein